MKWNLSLPESQMLVYYLVKLTGLAPFTVKNNKFHPPTLLGKSYPVFVAASYLLFLSIILVPTLGEFYTDDKSIFLKVWTTILYFASCPSIIFTPVIFMLTHEKIVYLMNKLCAIGNELKSSGIEEDHRKIFRNIFVISVMANASGVVIYVVEAQSDFFYAIKHVVENAFTLNTILIFIQILICIRRRFTLINENLYDLSVPAGDRRFPHHARMFVLSMINNPDEDLPESGSLTDLQRIRKIMTLHSEFCDLVNRTTQLFATPILLIIFRIFVHFVLLFYWIYSVLRNSSSFNIFVISGITFRIVIAIVELFIIAHASVTICQQGNATRFVLFKVWGKFESAEIKKEFSRFSNQLLHTTVTVSAFGFLAFNYTFVCKIFFTVITYVITVIQFEPSPSNN